MELQTPNEHQKCFNFEHSSHPRVELAQYPKGERRKWVSPCNEILFILKGKARLGIYHGPEWEELAGSVLFIPSGYDCTFRAVSDLRVLILRPYQPIRLCEGYYIENLFAKEEIDVGNLAPARLLTSLKANSRINHYVQGLLDCVADKINCKHFFDMKIREFFLLLRAYYPKSEIREFLRPILSPDTAFSEYVRNNRHNYPTVLALAESMHLTHKQFSMRFKKIFDQTAYNWMKEEKAHLMQIEIKSTNKPFKQIALENGFGTISQFSKFCKKELGKNPVNLRSDS